LTRPIDIAGFERKFAETDDPWRCRSSGAEALKRRRALAGRPLAATALDVACGDGAGTRALAGRALRVDAVDGAEAALAAAGRLLGRNPRIRLRRARVPRDLPRGRWQRILVSELAYYLPPHQIEALADALIARLAPGGELISVHHVVPFDDATTPPSRAVALLHRRLARRLDRCRVRRYGRYIVAQWRARAARPRRAPPGRRSPRPRIRAGSPLLDPASRGPDAPIPTKTV
jgi:SAM-dependent methyltransferase